MGNSSSRPNTPGGSPHESPTNTAKRKPPTRKESLGGLSHKGSTVAPSASLESATGRPSKSSSQTRSSHIRGRSQTLPTHERTGDGAELRETSTTGSLSNSRSKSPRPPLNLDTSSPAPPDNDPISRTASSSHSASSDSPTPYYAPHGHFGRAPRLPLPIEEEELDPTGSGGGSPKPQDFIDKTDIHKYEFRNESLISGGTIDEDNDLEDDGTDVTAAPSGPLVETMIEWFEGGGQVYVTGTFCAWQKKLRLHEDGPSKTPNAFSRTVALPPGNNYLAFLVDGSAMTARHLPTTVDDTGTLVNYVTVPAEPPHQPWIPTDGRTMYSPRSQADDRLAKSISGTSQPTPEARPATDKSAKTGGVPGRTASGRQGPSSDARPKQVKPRRFDDKTYHTDVPSYLLDWDAPENSTKVRRANAVAHTHQTPPQMPPYLSKSIISIQTTMKDDASVLAVPNHTVLNHLATSSIKDNVLGTSATTRYKKKYVTTIMYMPTSTSGS